MLRVRTFKVIAATLTISALTLVPAFAQGATTIRNPLLPSGSESLLPWVPETPENDIRLCGCGISLPPVENRSSGGYLGPSLTRTESPTQLPLIPKSLFNDHDIDLCTGGCGILPPPKQITSDGFGYPLPPPILSEDPNSLPAAPASLTALTTLAQSTTSPGNLTEKQSITEESQLIDVRHHFDPINSIAFSPDGKTLAGGCYAHIELWDVASGKRLLSLFADHEIAPDAKGSNSIHTMVGRDHPSASCSVAFRPGGKTFASSHHGKIQLWNVLSGKELRTLSDHPADVCSIAFSPDGKTVACGGETVEMHSLSSEKDSRTLPSDSAIVHSVAFSPDGKILADGTGNKTVELWDAASGTQLRTLTGLSSFVRSVAFSPDGKILASGGGDRTVKLWEVSSGKVLRDLSDPLGVVNSVVLSPDGKRLPSLGVVNSVAFSPDGKTLASGSADRTINLWDVASGNKLCSPPRQLYAVFAVAFSPDGKKLVSAGNDDKIKLWEVSSGKELSSFSRSPQVPAPP